MLKIKPVRSYVLARYPRQIYCESRRVYSGNLVTAGITSVVLLALLASACVEEVDTRPGLVGPPPMPPDYMTENEARLVINKVFNRNGIKLDADVPLSFLTDNKDQISLNIDGFNSELNIGYEYIFFNDTSTFTPEIVAELDRACATKVTGPFIYTIYPPRSPAEIESLTQEFITSLRSKGIL